jgi:protein-S-isoprenylcysteine O-methyltransferase Ste14
MEQPVIESIGEAPDSSPSALAAAFAWGGAILFAASLLYFLYAYLVRFGSDVLPGGRFRPVAIDVALFSFFALHHSLFARSRLKAVVRRIVPPFLERSLYTWVASVLFLIVCSSWQLVPGALYRLDDPWRWLALGVQAAGILLVFLGSQALDVLDLAGIRPLMRARAAHGPLMTTGAYGVVRHPLYFGWTLFVFGAADMTATRAVFAIVSTGYCALAIPWEERGLVDVFGQEYYAYRRKVRWRMIPGVY